MVDQEFAARRLREMLVSLRDLRAAHDAALARFEVLIEQADPGLDVDEVAEFDERVIALDHFGAIRSAIDDLLRLLAATQGRDRLAALVLDAPEGS